MTMLSANPLVRMSEDPDDPGSVLELKTRLVLYLEDPPAREEVRRLYDLYMPRYGGDITHYRSTAFGAIPDEWTPATRRRFEHSELPGLYEHVRWGYLFGADRPTDARVFLFHGSRPASEAGRASILRFDFEWDFPAEELRHFAGLVLQQVECICGTVGYVLTHGEADAGIEIEAQVMMFAAAMRYWGAEAQDLDVTLERAVDGFPCISWLTIVGPRLRSRHADAVNRARAVAHASFDVNGHTVVQTEERPRLIDRNRREPLGNYPAVAEALLPLQLEDHPPFSDDPWDEDLTYRYLHRFTREHDL
jgi:Protein of unknown function (DUF3396)